MPSMMGIYVVLSFPCFQVLKAQIKTFKQLPDYHHVTSHLRVYSYIEISQLLLYVAFADYILYHILCVHLKYYLG